MSLRHPTRRLPLEERLERAASVANLAMLRSHSLPSHIQIESINWLTFLLGTELRSIPTDDTLTREKVVNQLAINRSILAPIRRLPKELLIEIFFLVAAKTPLRTLNVAVILSHVCAVWRAVARGLSKLWNKLVVRSLSDFDQYCELFLPITTQDRRPGLRCDDPEMLSLLWDRIEPYASSWGSLTLMTRLSMLPDLQVLYMENLERLVVDASDAPSSSELSVLDFVVAPRLRHVALTLDTLQSERQLHIPATRMLTSLEIITESPFPVTLILSLLPACANTLQSLTLKIRYPLEGPEGSYPTSTSDVFVMESLTFLSLVDPACALLNHITTPRIEVLILSNVPAYGAQSLLRFLKRGQAAQQLMDLRVYKPEERDIPPWLPCLQLLDNLRDLHFDDLLSKKEFLELMTLRPDKPRLFPLLEHVNICQIFQDHEELFDIIADMCASRGKETTINGEEAYVLLGWIKD